jgi:SAM-dependent methyltransferase
MTSATENARFYNRLSLSIYDVALWKVAAPIVWRCPSNAIRHLYRQHAAQRHLEIGPGTGFFLDDAFVLRRISQLVLADASVGSLTTSRLRVASADPAAALVDASTGLPFRPGAFDSVGLNFVLHCVPGADLHEKATMISATATVLSSEGRLFGSTLLGVHPANPVARVARRIGNRAGLFDNQGDRLEDLETVLAELFTDVSVARCGAAATFVAIRPRHRCGSAPRTEGRLPRF